MGPIPGNSQKSSCNFPLGNCKKIATDAFGTPHKKTHSAGNWYWDVDDFPWLLNNSGMQNGDELLYFECY